MLEGDRTMTLDESSLKSLLGYDVVDQDGKTLGNLETFWVDRGTGVPEWLGVFSGTFRTHHRLVPIRGANRDAHAIRVPWAKDQVDDAPEYSDPDAPIPEEMEREAYRHYGLEPARV
jgi:sporulation protein YlmC with PRC-barrel domain